MSNQPGGPYPSQGKPHPYQTSSQPSQFGGVPGDVYGGGPGNRGPAGNGPSTTRILLVIFAVISVLGLLSCGCCGGLLYVGMKVDTQEVARSVENDATFKSEIGLLESCDFNLIATGEADDDVFVYDVAGDKGKGRLFMTEYDDGTRDGELKTGNGSFPLTVDQSVFTD